jgi:hypothetical protein
MAKPLVFLFGDQEVSLNLNKVDRSKLYGFKEVEAVDEHEEVCELATLADDGRTMIGRGGTGLCWLDADGSWCNKAALKPVDVNGDEIRPVPSSFSAPIKLFDNATPEDLLGCNIRLVYSLQAITEDANLAALLAELKRGTIFTFPYSYRGGLEADTAFLLNNEDGEAMLAVGNKTEFAFIGIQSQLLADDAEDAIDEEEDSMSFDMI